MSSTSHITAIRRSHDAACLSRSDAIHALTIESIPEDVATDLIDCDRETFNILLNVTSGVEFLPKLPQPRRVA